VKRDDVIEPVIEHLRRGVVGCLMVSGAPLSQSTAWSMWRLNLPVNDRRYLSQSQSGVMGQ
jgi:hypothetical protein